MTKPLFADNWYGKLPADEVRKEVQGMHAAIGSLADSLGSLNLTWDSITGKPDLVLRAGDTMTGALEIDSAAPQLIVRGGSATKGLQLFRGTGTESFIRNFDASDVAGSIRITNNTLAYRPGNTTGTFQTVWHNGNVPSTFPPDAHTHVEADITDLGSYLPLAGGTLTGDLTVANADVYETINIERTGGDGGTLTMAVGADGNERFPMLAKVGGGSFRLRDAGPRYYDGAVEREMWHAGNIDPVSKAGDTMTGDLRVLGGIGSRAGVYEHSYLTAGGTDTGWKILSTVTFGTTAYAGMTFEIVVEDPETNYGSSRNMKTMRYVAAASRSQGTLNDTRLWRVSGAFNDYIRGVRISDSEYQLQARQRGSWSKTNFRIRAVASDGVATHTYASAAWASLPAGGTGVAVYSPDPATGMTERFVRATFSNGISFDGGTQWLDAYESGTWTPTVTGWTSVAYGASRSGHYVRIGKTLHLWGRIPGTGTTPSSTAFAITNLPMSILSSRSVGTIGMHNNLATTAARPVAALWATNTTSLVIYRSGPGVTWQGMNGNDQGTTAFDIIFHAVCELA